MFEQSRNMSRLACTRMEYIRKNDTRSGRGYGDIIGEQEKPKNSAIDRAVTIAVDDVRLQDNLHIPEKTKGLVVFAYGSGSSRHSSRNRYVAEVLNEQQLGALLIELLSAQEEQVDLKTRHLRFDIPLLANRLVDIVDWIKNQDEIKYFTIGYFGSSTGCDAALIAAANKPEPIRAIVSRGGRPDLAVKIFSSH